MSFLQRGANKPKTLEEQAAEGVKDNPYQIVVTAGKDEGDNEILRVMAKHNYEVLSITMTNAGRTKFLFQKREVVESTT